MLLFLAARVRAEGFIIKAVDKNGKYHDFANVSFKPRQTKPASNLMIEEPFKDNEIEYFSITRKDGAEVTSPAPQSTKKVRIALFLSNEEPVSFSVQKGSKPLEFVNMKRQQAMKKPEAKTSKEQQGGSPFGGILPMILIFFLITRCMSGMKQQVAAAQGGNA